MEISSNAPSGKRPQSGSSQFSFLNDMQEGSAFDLLLSLPIAPSPTVEFNSEDEPVSRDASDSTVCQSCETTTQQEKETESSEEPESNTDEANSTDLASSVAAIDTIVAQQSQPTEQPISKDQSEVASQVELPKSEATEPAQDSIGNQTQEAPSAEKPDPSVLPDSAGSPQAVDAADESTVSTTQPQLVQAASDTQQNQQQNSEDGQPQPTQSTQQKPVEDIPELSNQTAEVIAKPQTSSVEADVSTEEALPNKTTTEPVRRGQQRERSARWYEREPDEALASESVANKLQAAEQEKTSPAELAEQVSVDQQSDPAVNLPTKDDDAAVAEAELIQTASVTDELTSGPAIGASSGSTSGSTVGNATTLVSESSSSSDVKPTIAPGLDRAPGKATSSIADPLQSAQTGTQVDISQAEKVRLVQRVARSFSRVGPTGGSVQLRLHPPELGALAMQIRIEGKDMTARLTTESQAAREVIMESLPQLRSRLAEQGYDVVQFTVDVASDSSSVGDQSSWQSGPGQGGSGQNGAGQGSTSEGSTRQSPFEMRRSSYLRRQLDLAHASSSPHWTNRVGNGKGIDIQA